MTPDDYLAGRESIIELLKAKRREFRQVVPFEDIAELEAPPTSPMAYVLFDGEEIRAGGAQAVRGRSQLVLQRWLVVIAVLNAAQRQAAADERAGPLISKTIKTLVGQQPEPFTSPLYRLQAPRVSYGKNFALYPLMLAGELVTS